MCIDYDPLETAAALAAAPPASSSETALGIPPPSSYVYLFESFPGASGGVVLLDFDGQNVPAGSRWERRKSD